MTKYEELEQLAHDQHIMIHEDCDFANETAETPIKGLFSTGHIFLASDLKTTEDKVCVLAEELGHHFTSAGNITDQHVIANRQQEQVARLWAYNYLIGLEGIVSAYRAGCQNQNELAQHLEVTEQFLVDAITKYRSIYGVSARIGTYIIIFEPVLAVIQAVTSKAAVREVKPAQKQIKAPEPEKTTAPPVEAVVRAKTPPPKKDKKRRARSDAALTRAYKRSLKAAETLGMDHEDYIFAVHDAELMRGY